MIHSLTVMPVTLDGSCLGSAARSRAAAAFPRAESAPVCSIEPAPTGKRCCTPSTITPTVRDGAPPGTGTPSSDKTAIASPVSYERVRSLVEPEALDGCRAGPATQTMAVEHHHRRSRTGCECRSREPRQPSADHNHIHSLAIAHVDHLHHLDDRHDRVVTLHSFAG